MPRTPVIATPFSNAGMVGVVLSNATSASRGYCLLRTPLWGRVRQRRRMAKADPSFRRQTAPADDRGRRDTTPEPVSVSDCRSSPD